MASVPGLMYFFPFELWRGGARLDRSDWFLTAHKFQLTNDFSKGWTPKKNLLFGTLDISESY